MQYADAINYLYSSRPPFHMVGAKAYKPGLEKTLCPWDFLGKSTGVVAISFSRESSQPRDRTEVSHIVDKRFTI